MIHRKVIIKTWDALKRAGTYGRFEITGPEGSYNTFTNEMESMMPEGRVIRLRSDDRWTPNGKYAGIHYIIEKWMIDAEATI